ncbi:hypothetical protein FQZ97_816450 [compost metagenome]
MISTIPVVPHLSVAPLPITILFASLMLLPEKAAFKSATVVAALKAAKSKPPSLNTAKS